MRLLLAYILGQNIKHTHVYTHRVGWGGRNMCNVHCCNHPSSHDIYKMILGPRAHTYVSESQLGGRHPTVG